MNQYIEAAEIFTSLLTEIYNDPAHHHIRKKFGKLIIRWFGILLQMRERGVWIMNMESTWTVFPPKEK
jgi:hypothetical protein